VTLYTQCQEGSERDLNAKCYAEFYGQSSITSDLLSALHSLHRQTLLLVGSHAAPPTFGTVFPHVYALLIVLLVLGLSSRLDYNVLKTFVSGPLTAPLSAPLIPLPGLSRLLIRYLLVYLLVIKLSRLFVSCCCEVRL